MSDGPVADPPQGSPSRRALGAMELAVRRARERSGPTGVSAATAEVPRVASPPSPTPPALADSSRPEPARDVSAKREHWLGVSVAIVAVLVIGMAIALAISVNSGGPQVAAPPPSTVTSTTHGGPSSSASPHGKGRSSRGSSASSRTTTSSTAPAVVAGGPPVISSINPASGAAGQGIEVAGSNFLSSDGQIVAMFNGQVASTSCPAPNACTVTVPPMSGAPSATVTIRTASGTSNSVTFTYS